MERAKVIIVSGPPCAGKTTLAEKLAKRFKLPIISRKMIRDLLFNTYDCEDLSIFNKSRQVGFNIMFILIKLFLHRSQSFIIDSAFNSDRSRKKICEFQKKYKFDCLLIDLRATGEVLWSRYQARIKLEQKRQDYFFNSRLRQIKKLAFRGFTPAPKISGKTIKIDMTNFKKVNYQKIIQEVKAFQAA